MNNDKRIEIVNGVLDQLHQNQPANHHSPILIISPKAQRLLWKHAVNAVLKSYQKRKALIFHGFGFYDEAAFEAHMDKELRAHPDPVVFVVDDDFADRDRIMASIKTLSPDRGHRMFMTRSALPTTNMLRTDKAI